MCVCVCYKKPVGFQATPLTGMVKKRGRRVGGGSSGEVGGGR